MSTSEKFATGVVDGSGVWPGEPNLMSYSSLKEIEECPRRWMLRRAHYPQIWDRAGYPDSPSIASLFGDVVHATLERLLQELVRHGCDSLGSPCAVAALEECGGYTSLIDSILAARLDDLVKNPRLRERLPGIRSAIRLKRPELRQRVQLIISRSKFSLNGPVDSWREHSGIPDTTVVGSYAEVELRAETLGWTGKADLITVTPTACAIVDYKTGLPHESHAEQLQIYALLWSLDKSRNPSARLATDLTVAYSTRCQLVQAPSDVELLGLETKVRSRTQAALLELRERPPEARPAVETCNRCSVRHLCADYWRFLQSMELTGQVPGAAGQFGDVELRIVGRHGPRSWTAALISGTSTSRAAAVRLQTASEQVSFAPGAHFRLLNVAIERDEESRNLVLTMTQNSEAFRVDPTI